MAADHPPHRGRRDTADGIQVCCAGPLLALLGGLGAASEVEAIWVPALALLAVVAVVALVVVRRRRRVSACASAPGPVELGLPTAARTRGFGPVFQGT